MRLKGRYIPFVILGLFWGIIGISMMTGFWQTKTSTEQAVIKTPQDIKGWMTLQDISDAFKIPMEELVRVWELPSTVDINKPIKEIARGNGKETEYYRDLLNNRLKSVHVNSRR